MPIFKIEESKDPDARWLKKGKRCNFGYKMFVATQEKSGFIEHVAITASNQSEVSYLPQFLEGHSCKKKRIYADKGYTSKENRLFLKKSGLKMALWRKQLGEKH